MSIHATKLADTVGFEILGKALGKDVEVSLGKAIAAGAVFCACEKGIWSLLVDLFALVLVRSLGRACL